MIAPRAIAMLVASLALCVCAEAALAKVTRPRHPAAAHSAPSNGRAVQRKTPPVVHAPAQDEKNWMDRASAPSNSGGGGGGGGGGM